MLHGEQGVPVRRKPVVDVVLDQAGQRAELGQVPTEDAQLVHLGQGHGDAPPAPADVQEEIPRHR